MKQAGIVGRAGGARGALLAALWSACVAGCGPETRDEGGAEGSPCDGAVCATGLACIDGFCQPMPAASVLPPATPSGGVGGRTNDMAPGPVLPSGCAAGCAATEVCVANECVAVPASCPCPLETYCDLGTSSCQIGCTMDSHCDAGRICVADERRCEAGCREDAQCGPGFICEGTTCLPGCRADADCGPGSICEGTSCQLGCRVDAECDPSHACLNLLCVPGCRAATDCPSAEMSCVDAVCVCPAPKTVCGAECADLSNSSLHCGLCGQICEGEGAACIGGTCTCPPGTTDCEGSCVDLMTDRDYCGGCWSPCPQGAAVECISGGCAGYQQPEEGIYSSCTAGEFCGGGFCLALQINNAGICSRDCTGPDDMTCAPNPAGTAVGRCKTNEGDPTRHACVLDCSLTDTEDAICPPGTLCGGVGGWGRICL